MPDIRIRIIREALSDRSEVFNVVLSYTDNPAEHLIFAAVTELDAGELADKIANAVHEHTVNRVWR